MNIIALTGNVVKDPETRTTPSGKSVSRLRIASNHPLNDDEVLYIDVETWDKQSEFVSKYVKKGSGLEVTGRLKLDQWEKDGVKQSKHLVVADRVHFSTVGGKKKDGDNSQKTYTSNTKPDEQSSEQDDIDFATAAGIKS